MLVIGGTGGVGAGIVDALLSTGTFGRVVVSSRDERKLEALRAHAGAHRQRLVTIRGGVDTMDDAKALLADVLERGELGAVVASLGGWRHGPALTELDEQTWHDGIATFVTPHFIAARTFVPALERDGARYLLIGGGAATQPVPYSALVSIGGAAQLMLARTLVAERRNAPYPIVEELVIDGPITTNAAHHGPQTDGEITAREVGNVVVDMLRNGTTGAWPNATHDGPIVTIRAGG